MKLPFNIILGPLLKPHLSQTRVFCQNATFAISVPYTYFYGTVGLAMNAIHLRKHLGDTSIQSAGQMLLHDLRIIATSMGLVQYACLLVGCVTENPALFLPHLVCQFIAIVAKCLSAMTLLTPNMKSIVNLGHLILAVGLMTFNWLQEFCVFRQSLCICDLYSFLDEANMLNNGAYLEDILMKMMGKHKNSHEQCYGGVEGWLASHVLSGESEGNRLRLRALVVALLGVSMSACAFASQPVELELDDDEVTQKLNNVSFARRLVGDSAGITKPTIRLVMGYGKLSAVVTAATSLLLLVAVMSKQSWWRHGARWLAAPALLVAALEVASDAGDAMLAAALRGSTEPAIVATQTLAAALLITIEILVWYEYFIAKFFEYNPPVTNEEREKMNQLRAIDH